MKKAPSCCVRASGSGKTTTAKMRGLEQGVSTVTISIVNYFKTLDPGQRRARPKARLILNLPSFSTWSYLTNTSPRLRGARRLGYLTSFSPQERSATPFTPSGCARTRSPFEGIHALNDCITYAHPEAVKLYISANSHLQRTGP